MNTDTINITTIEILGVVEELKALSKGRGCSVLYETETGSLEWLELSFPDHGYF